jgi:hypothetical protein
VKGFDHPFNGKKFTLTAVDVLGVGRRITPRSRRKALLLGENAKKTVLDGKKKYRKRGRCLLFIFKKIESL